MSPESMTADSKKPRVVCLGEPKFIGEGYLSNFQKEFDYSYLDASNRQQALELLPKDIKGNGPIYAFIVRMGTPAYEPFDEELLSPLTPDCRIIASASAGFNEFDTQWMASKGMYFCNTVWQAHPAMGSTPTSHTWARLTLLLKLRRIWRCSSHLLF